MLAFSFVENLKDPNKEYIINEQNDIIELADNSGKVVVSYAYNSWGKLLGIVGIKDIYKEVYNMSIKNYKKALEIIKENKNECFFVGQRYRNDIGLAEKALGLRFTGMYKEFLKEFGAGSIGSEEIYGISSLDFENATVPNGIWYTLIERKESKLPLNLVVIYDTGSDEVFCLDFSKVNAQGEPAVVVFVPGIDLEYQKYEIVAEDFGDFLLDRVTEAIENI